MAQAKPLAKPVSQCSVPCQGCPGGDEETSHRAGHSDCSIPAHLLSLWAVLAGTAVPHNDTHQVRATSTKEGASQGKQGKAGLQLFRPCIQTEGLSPSAVQTPFSRCVSQKCAGEQGLHCPFHRWSMSPRPPHAAITCMAHTGEEREERREQFNTDVWAGPALHRGLPFLIS